MNPDAPGHPVCSIQYKTRDKLNEQLARISEEHGVAYQLKKIGGVVRVVVGEATFPCQRVDVWRRPRFGTYLEVDNERVTG